MACKYTIGGREDATLDKTLKYVEDTSTNQREAFEVLEILLTEDIVVPIVDETDPEREITKGIVIEDSFIDDRINTLKGINAGAKEYFGVSGDLIKISKKGTLTEVTINTGILSSMKADPDAAYRANEAPEEQEGAVEEEEETEESQPESEETLYVTARRQLMDDTTGMLIVNLQKQIDRLSKIPETQLTKQKLAEMEVLKKELERIDKEKANLDDYMDFVDFTVRTSERAESLLAKIEGQVSENPTQEDRNKMLKDLSELKKTIDAFYNDNSSRSLVNNLEELVKDLDDVQEDIDDTVILLRQAASAMKRVNEKFLDTGLELLTDNMLESAPPQINIELNERIAGIKANRRIDGLSRMDRRYRAARAEGMGAVLDLNILQLEEKKIGRASILKELRQTHKDQSWFSAFFSPVVYNKQASVQLFAESVRNALVTANDETLDFKYDILQPSFQAFKAWKMSQGNISEDNVEKLYEDFIEKITVSSLDKNGDRVDTEALAFMQEFDMNKFNLAKANAFETMRSEYNFPEDPTQYDEYFKSAVGKAYLGATARWYAENTESVDGAETILAALRSERDAVYAEIQRLKPEGHSDRLSALYLQYNDLKYQLLKSYRNGQFIGKLSKPKLSEYKNTKYAAMPAEARAYYDVLLAQYKKDQKRLGRSSLLRNSWEDFSYILPSVRKDAYDRLMEQGPINSAKDLAIEGFRKQETDTEFGALLDAHGEKIRMIPQYFTNLVDAKDVSQDVTNSMIKFNDMSNRYNAKSEILGVVTMMETALKSRKKLTMQPDGTYLLDNTARRLGRISSRFEADDPLGTRTYDQVKSFIDNTIYGMSEQESMDSQFDRINKNKAANFAVTLTAFSTLSFNWLQAGNQLLLDKMTGTQEAVAGDFYGVKDLAWARGKMAFGGQLSMMNDKFLPKFGKKNKLAKFLESFDAFQAFGNEFGKEAGTAKKKALSRDSFMVLQQTAEMLVVAERALAMAHATAGKMLDSSGKVILNENGKPAHLYDLLTENNKGKLILDPRVATTGKYAFNKAKFIAKLHGMMKRTNQLKGGFDRVQAQRSAVGKLGTLFRNYLVPGLRKRFGNFDGAMIDIEMAAVNEGYYVTFMNQMINAMLDLQEGKIGAAIGKIRPGIFKSTKNLDRTEANVRRMYYEVMMSTVLTMMATSLVDMMDDEEEEGYVGSYVAYQLLRLSSEWSQFRSTALIDVIQDPTAAANPVRHLAEALRAIYIHLGYKAGFKDESEALYQVRSGRWQKGEPKVYKEILDFAPVLRGFFTSSDPEEARKYYDMKKK